MPMAELEGGGEKRSGAVVHLWLIEEDTKAVAVPCNWLGLKMKGDRGGVCTGACVKRVGHGNNFYSQRGW